MAAILIASLDELDALGRLLAAILPACGNPPLYLIGDLGSGKTALTAQICKYWPGGEEAEVASPSFTHCNFYPGRPPVIHCDLYRSRSISGEIAEWLEPGRCQLIVEWAEFMPAWAREHLDICFNVINDLRRLEFRASGASAIAAQRQIESGWLRQNAQNRENAIPI